MTEDDASKPTRRDFIAGVPLALLGGSLMASCGGGGGTEASTATATPAAVPNRPLNLLFFLTDDQRNDTLGCAGHPVIKTPNIDALAAQGTRFANTFVTTSICAASRASILTGVVERTHQYTFEAPPLAEAWCANSYPSLLRTAGYRTGHIGKLGVVVSPKSLTALYDSFRPHDRTPYFNRLADGTVIHETDLAAQRAIEFLQSQPSGQPFNLNVCFNAPHAEDFDLDNLFPWPPSADGLYETAQIPAPRLSEPAYFESLPDFLKSSLNRERFYWCCDSTPKYQRNMRAYYRMITGIDTAIGRVLAELDRLGLAKDTMVVYAADNGYYMGDRGFADKWSHFEQSLRVPLIVRDPLAPASTRGQVLDTMALNIDLAPTFLSAAMLSSPAASQGQSLLPWVRGTTTRTVREQGFFEHLWVTPSIPRWEGMRTTRYKYARYFGVSPAYEFLHDMQTDPDERLNVAQSAAYAGVLTSMREMTRATAIKYEAARLPTP
jgi:arylsulfatase A-like enzyme